jgi:dephospho-CoA kinase
MIVVGLTGSIAMGKSEVARVFAAHKIPVFDSDREVHRLYDSGDGVALLKPHVPEAIVDGRVNRPKLSEAVLADKSLLEKLETIVHAVIARRRTRFLENAELEGHAIAVVDVPLLFEKAQDTQVDVTIVVSAPEQLQHQRALARPGMTEEKLGMILARQMPDAQKRARADIIIENNGSLEDLRRSTAAVIQKLRKQPS